MNVSEMCQATSRKQGGGRPDVQTPCIYVFYNLEVLTANVRYSGNRLCGTTYRRIIEEADANSNQSDVFQRGENEHIQSSSSGSQRQLKAPNASENSVNDEMQHYTRLHILTKLVKRVLPTSAALDRVLRPRRRRSPSARPSTTRARKRPTETRSSGPRAKERRTTTESSDPRIKGRSRSMPGGNWYCHKCNSGPYNIVAQLGCTNVINGARCDHPRCNYCKRE